MNASPFANVAAYAPTEAERESDARLEAWRKKQNADGVRAILARDAAARRLAAHRCIVALEECTGSDA